VKSMRRRSAVRCLIYYPAFCLQILVLIGLAGTKARVDAGIVKAEHDGSCQPQAAEGETGPIPISTGPSAATLLALAEF
jgi:hypothetical protein